MTLADVYRGLKAAIREVHIQIHEHRYHSRPTWPFGTVGPEGPYGSYNNCSDTQLLEMIRKATDEYKELRDELTRLRSDGWKRVEACRSKIVNELPELVHLVKEDWELR